MTASVRRLSCVVCRLHRARRPGAAALRHPGNASALAADRVCCRLAADGRVSAFEVPSRLLCDVEQLHRTTVSGGMPTRAQPGGVASDGTPQCSEYQLAGAVADNTGLDLRAGGRDGGRRDGGVPTLPARRCGGNNRRSQPFFHRPDLQMLDCSTSQGGHLGALIQPGSGEHTLPAQSCSGTAGRPCRRRSRLHDARQYVFVDVAAGGCDRRLSRPVRIYASSATVPASIRSK